MLNIESIRTQFPAFQRKLNGREIAFFDGPAGSQVPQSVIEAVSGYLANTNANCGAPFVTSQLSDALQQATRVACAEFLNATSPDEIVFGPNMTSLTFALSRTLSDTWFYGDEVIVSRLDHDANVTPWVQAAESAGVVVKYIDFDRETCTLDMEQYTSLLSSRTKLVAIGAASNATGTVNPVKKIVQLAKSVGALTFVDAVHYAPHRAIDVEDFGCDFLACSAYKFFGPHVGVLWGKAELLERLHFKKLRPSPETIPGKWMTGTQNHEGIAGLKAAIDYLTELGGGESTLPRRERLLNSYQAIENHEANLGKHLLDGLSKIDSLRVWGITDPEMLAHRVPTVSVTHKSIPPRELSEALGAKGFLTWAGNHYAVPFTEFAGLEPQGTLRIGLLHYNSHQEVERLLEQLEDFC